MNYFTPAWHSGEIEDEDNAVYKRYQKHLDGLLPQWPPDIQALAVGISLHDGLIRELSWDADEATVFLNLRCGNLQVGYFDLDLHYSGVLFSPPDLQSLAVLKSDKVGEALYDEMDEKEGRFVHRILFISSEKIKKGWFEYYEVAVRFQQLRLVTTPRKSRFDANE